MSSGLSCRNYERAITPVERLFTRSPYSLVTMVARIKGAVTEHMLREAVDHVRLRHPNLRVRIEEDENGEPRFTSQGAGAIPIEVLKWESEEQWIGVLEETARVPFDFAERPAIRFFLLRAPTRADLMIVCHHILCDGMSLAYLARDLMKHLGDESLEVEVLPDPISVDSESIPPSVSLNFLVKAILRRINRKWEQERVVFNQGDYQNLTAAYWENIHHATLPIELSEEQTAELVARCRAEKVTVNTALTAAFADALASLEGAKPSSPTLGVAVSLRDRLRVPVGESMGFYAGVVNLKHIRKKAEEFWESARRLQKKLKPLVQGQSMLKDPLTWCHMDPTTLEAMNFKKLGGLVPQDAPRHRKLAAFAKREDVVQAMLKRERMESLSDVRMGMAMTNLTRLDFPRMYGGLELDRLILQPGGAFPLTQVGLVVGAVTCSGKLSLVMEFAKEAQDVTGMQHVGDRAIGLLLGGNAETERK